jgi:hypothetical protein
VKRNERWRNGVYRKAMSISLHKIARRVYQSSSSNIYIKTTMQAWMGKGA